LARPSSRRAIQGGRQFNHFSFQESIVTTLIVLGIVAVIGAAVHQSGKRTDGRKGYFVRRANGWRGR
jgi:hypothetical protein